MHDNNFLVGLSIDGPREIHDTFRVDSINVGTYQKLMNTAKLFNQYKVEYNILCVVNNIVANNAKEVFNFFKSHNFKYLQYIPCLDSFNDDEKHDYSLSSESYAKFLKVTFDKYYLAYKSGKFVSIRNFDNYVGMLAGHPPESCGMSGKCNCYFVIEGDGSVFPCDFYVLDKYKLGNLNILSFEQMIKSSVAKGFVEESKPVSEECTRCQWNGLCRGGCRRNREPFVKDKPALNQYCGAYKEFFSYSYPRLVEMAKDTVNCIVK